MTHPWTSPALALALIAAGAAQARPNAPPSPPADGTSRQGPEPSNPRACISIETDSQRLACYDHALGRDRMPGVASADERDQDQAPAPAASTAAPPAVAPELAGAEPKPPVSALFRHDRNVPVRARAPVSLLDSRWELSPDTKLGTFNVRGYKPVYLLPVFYTTSVNDRPSSPVPDHTVTEPLRYDRLESKFQLSFKTKLAQGVIKGHGDLWFGYTQSSRWQVYNSRLSRPFRETNYEPEAMLVFATDYSLMGWRGRLLGIGVNHQSNGRSNPLSRSWNRIIADIGFERPGWTVVFRPWWRIPESRFNNDNPDIQDYMGRADMVIVHEASANEYSLMLRHSLRTGSHSRGAVKFTWAFPIRNKLRGYVEVFNGYGESLIDYNHHATYIGIGVSLLGWY